MTTPQQRITLDDPMDLLIRPVEADDQPEPDDKPDDERGQRP